MNGVVVLTMVLAVLAGSRIPDPPVELEAKVWHAPPSIRIPEDRTVVLLFFTTFQAEDLEPLLRRLNKLHRRLDTVVIGLTPESSDRVDRFIKSKGIRFTVGSQSRTYRDFGVKRFPKLIVFEPEGGRRHAFPDVRSFDRWVPPREEDPVADFSKLDESTSRAFLEEAASTSLVRDERARALTLLRDKLPTADFLDLCDRILEQEGDFRLRGEVEFRRHLADPSITQKEEVWAPSVEALHRWREEPDAPQWRELGRFMDEAMDQSTAELYDEFLGHLTEEPADLLIRRNILSDFERRAVEIPEEQPEIRRFLLDMLGAEPDFAVRLRIVGGLTDVCQPGDFEVVEFLEEKLQTETNVRHVRPMMHYVIRYLRTGEE